MIALYLTAPNLFHQKYHDTYRSAFQILFHRDIDSDNLIF